MKKLLTLAFGLVTLAVLTGAAPQRTTPWLNRDLPGGVGDYETTMDHLKIQCRFKATGKAITEGAPVGYHCNIKEGGSCKNNDPVGLRCQDMEVMFSWGGGATPWLNRDQPGGVGDYETTTDHLKIQCRFKATGKAITEGAPVGYHCNIKEGGWCKNNDPAGLKCQDMEVMFSWAGCVGCAATPRETSGELFNETGARARPLGPNPVIGQQETGARARPVDRNPVEPNPVVGQLPPCGRGISKGDSCCATGNGLCLVARGDGWYNWVVEGGPLDKGQCDCVTK